MRTRRNIPDRPRPSDTDLELAIARTKATPTGPTGNRIEWAAAAPAAGNWLRGDVVFNSAATVGQPKGWRCTVAGTPGTWVSEGNL